VDIFAPSDDPRHPTPQEGRRLADARRVRDGGYEVTVSPGADVADVIDALAAVPIDAIFVEVFDDVDAVLMFRPIPPAAPWWRSPAPRAPRRALSCRS